MPAPANVSTAMFGSVGYAGGGRKGGSGGGRGGGEGEDMAMEEEA